MTICTDEIAFFRFSFCCRVTRHNSHTNLQLLVAVSMMKFECSHTLQISTLRAFAAKLQYKFCFAFFSSQPSKYCVACFALRTQPVACEFIFIKVFR